MTKDVLLYDPNARNPYGRELARVIARTGARVVWLGQRGVAWSALTPSRAVLTPPLDASTPGRRVLGVLGRVADPLRAAARLVWAGREGQLVVVWLRDGWEALVFGLLGRRCTFIHHNPVPERALGPGVGLVLPWLLGRCHVVVHSDAYAREGYDVVPHPSYEATVSRAVDHRSSGPEQPLQVLYAGALRADKGVDELPKILARLDSRFELVLTAGPPLPPRLLEAAGAAGVAIVSPRDSRPVDDDAFVDSFRRAWVVIAPYTNVTESGTITMALTLGAAVLAYRTPALESALLPCGLVDGAAELSTRLRAWAGAGRPSTTFRESSQARDVRAAAAWGRLLHGATAC